MRLSTLIASNDGTTLHGEDVEVTGLTSDSREVKPGDLFVAVPGTQQDGRAYISDAVKRGAVALLLTEEANIHDKGDVILPPLRGELEGGLSPQSQTSVLVERTPHPASPARGEELQRSYGTTSILTTNNIRTAASAIAAKFFLRQPETIAAITGTSGKTSTAQFVREIWQTLGYKSASLGTLGLVTAEESHYGSLTTPDPIALHKTLDECAGKGITHLAMEASSHGLALHRLDHVRIKSGGFTNLSRDHMDFHNSVEDYLAAKLRLFTEVMPSGATAVLNADIPEFDMLARHAERHALKVISYGKKALDIKLLETRPDAKGQILRFECLGKNYTVLLPVIGGFQAWNGLCALGLVLACGADQDKAVASLGKVSGVPGRLQLVGTTPKGGAVFVDYAHKPDALENVLQALRPHVAAHPGSKLGVVFGCGGNRDKGKRPLMGEIARHLADWVIVTDDNPRLEEPAVIRREILAGAATGPALQEIGDRAEAIQKGIAQLGAHDVLIIAGKGHESGQIVDDKVLPFDDAEVARKVLEV